MNRKALGATFLAGVLICGLGTGIAFAQYSKFEYAGERIVGTENLVSETLEADVEADGEIYLDIFDPGGTVTVEQDETVPTDKIYFDVVYNPDRAEMSVRREKVVHNTEYIIRTVDEYGNEISVDYGDSADYGEYFDYDNYPEEGYVYRVGRYKRYDDMREFFEVKDELLADLKRGKIGSYRTIWVESVTVRVNPANIDRIELNTSY